MQTIFDSGTYEELCKRQSITTESIFGEEEEELDVDDSPSPSSVPQLVPTLQNDVAKKRAKLVRKQSVMQYVKDQHSIDDDPVTSLYTVSSNSTMWKLQNFSVTQVRFYVKSKLANLKSQNLPLEQM